MTTSWREGNKELPSLCWQLLHYGRIVTSTGENGKLQKLHSSATIFKHLRTDKNRFFRGLQEILKYIFALFQQQRLSESEKWAFCAPTLYAQRTFSWNSVFHLFLHIYLSYPSLRLCDQRFVGLRTPASAKTPAFTMKWFQQYNMQYEKVIIHLQEHSHTYGIWAKVLYYFQCAEYKNKRWQWAKITNIYIPNLMRLNQIKKI